MKKCHVIDPTPGPTKRADGRYHSTWLYLIQWRIHMGIWSREMGQLVVDENRERHVTDHPLPLGSHFLLGGPKLGLLVPNTMHLRQNLININFNLELLLGQ